MILLQSKNIDVVHGMVIYKRKEKKKNMRGRPTSVCRLRVQASACTEQGWSELISNRTKRRLVHNR